MKSKRQKKNIKSLKYKRSNACAVVKARRNNKMELIMYKGGKCEKCGYSKPFPSVYHFHHKDAAQKSFTISRFMSRSLESLKKEADKCSLLCSNCHAEHHDRIYEEQLDKSILKIENLSDTELVARAKLRKKKARKYICSFCHREFTSNYKEQKFCSNKCRCLSRRKVKRPTKEILHELLKIYSYRELGRQFNVSDNTIRKWLL